MKRNMTLAAVALLVAALALVATVQASFYFTAEDLESDEALWELYGRWAAHHEVVREPGRFPTFKANAHMLHGKQRDASSLMAINVFGDQSFDEVMATTSCLVQKATSELEQLPVVDYDHLAATRKDHLLDLPSKVDWRSANKVTDVKKQGGCGCCWAFAIAAAVEGLHAIETNSAAISLSAQFLLDCTYPYVDQFSDCKGGSRYKALTLIKKVGGIPSESLYPYQGVKSICDTSKFDFSAGISGYFRLRRNNATVMKMAVSFQPITVTIGVDEDFVNWDPTVHGPVYYGPGKIHATHAVLIVGYDFDNRGELYWIVKNSWGTQWGDHGYIFISAEADTAFVGQEGVAGILENAIYLQ